MTLGLDLGDLDLDGSTILLTGGTGSFGNAFVSFVSKQWPDAVVRVLSRDEWKQSEMSARLDLPQVRYMIGDVRDRDRLVRAAQGADFIIHAAAMKQVPACEYNPSEAIRTNVNGAMNVVDAAIDTGVEKVVALSTDKAVNPVNLYGATKLCAEKTIVQGNAYAAARETRLACVRYGNVVGSRGSVVPLFREQAKQGKLTITDERMTRFWITLDQGVELVLFALAHLAGGEIFVPRIPSMQVTDLADVMAPEAEREVIGIRPGEKLHELLVTSDEARHTVVFDDVFVIQPDHPWWKPHPRWIEGKPIEDGFAFTSDTNDWWLTREELAEMLR